MNKQTLILAAALLAAAFTIGCSKENIGIRRFHVTTELPVEHRNGNPQGKSPEEAAEEMSKVSLSGTTLRWSAGDSIKIYDGSAGSAVYGLTSEAGNTTGQFDYQSGDQLDDGGYKAVYPCDISYSSTQITLPAVQHSATGALERLPLYAESDNDALRFYNICGVVRFRLTASSSVSLSSIAVTTNINTNGVATLSGSGTSTAITTPSGTATTTLAIVTPQNIASDKEFYMYLPAANYTSFVIELTATGNLGCTKTANTAIRINRGEITTITLTGLSFARVAPEGAINSLFSVSGGHQVYFSKGNLQYKASADSCRFAEHQYGNIGTGNNSISGSYDGWIDLFGWGTSGYHNPADSYNTNHVPYSASMDIVDEDYNYYGYGPSTNMADIDLTGSSAGYDWGVSRAIGNGGNAAGLWRTLTEAEWSYLLESRMASTVSGTPNARYAKGRVEGRNGLILLPDSYTHPGGITALAAINSDAAAYTANQYTADDWSAMESAGAVFLPVTGYRYYKSTFSATINGTYWSATGGVYGNDAYAIDFSDSYLNSSTAMDRFFGYAVRLVCD